MTSVTFNLSVTKNVLVQKKIETKTLIWCLSVHTKININILESSTNIFD